MNPVLILLFVVVIVDKFSVVKTVQILPKCEKIVSPICQQLGYNMTIMPNFAGHNNQHDAAKGLQAFQPLLHYNCSTHLRLFICSVFIPLCSEHVPGAVPACQGLCETVRQDCQPVLDRFLLPWPAELNCNRFPAPPDLCMHHPDVQTSHEDYNLHPSDVEVEAYNHSMVSDHQIVGFSVCPPRFILVEEVCAPLCGQDAYYKSHDKEFVRNWILIWSVSSTIISFLTVLTFWINQPRFRYPERPLFFMTICCFIYSTLTVFKILLGPQMVICHQGYLVTKSSENILCVSSAFLLQYFELAAKMYWMVFMGCWYLHAKLEWGHESLIGLSSLLHSFVIGFSSVPALLALGTGRITSNELTGSCGIREESFIWFVLIPQGLVLIVGLAFGVMAELGLVSVAKTVRSTLHSSRLHRLTARIAVVLLLYLVVELANLVASGLEAWQRPWWRSLAILSALDCRGCSHEPLYHSAALTPVFIRQASGHLLCVCCVMWVCSGKTFRTWFQVLSFSRKFGHHHKIPITKV